MSQFLVGDRVEIAFQSNARGVITLATMENEFKVEVPSSFGRSRPNTTWWCTSHDMRLSPPSENRIDLNEYHNEDNEQPYNEDEAEYYEEDENEDAEVSIDCDCPMCTAAREETN
jgi:hypothetical protein